MYHIYNNREDIMQKVKHPDVYEREINAIIDAGCYVNESEVINDALKILFASKPNLKLAAAIEMYKKEEVTLGRAAEIAGMGLIEFKEALKDRGIKIKVPKTSMNALDKQVARIRKIRGG
jgi:predicted HTH domain antitoxin